MFHVQIVNFPFLSFSFAALSDGALRARGQIECKKTATKTITTDDGWCMLHGQPYGNCNFPVSASLCHYILSNVSHLFFFFFHFIPRVTKTENRPEWWLSFVSNCLIVKIVILNARAVRYMSNVEKVSGGEIAPKNGKPETFDTFQLACEWMHFAISRAAQRRMSVFTRI